MKIMNKKRLAVLLASVLLLVVTVGGTIAFLVDSTDPLVNTFTPTSVNVTVTDNVSGNVKDTVEIKNTGKTSAYIRARIVGSWVSDKDNTTVVQAWDPALYNTDNPEAGGDGTFTGLPGTGWVKRESDGYYYYTEPVAPNRPTGTPLFTSYEVKKTVGGAHLVLDILVQAIQSEGGAALNAWGVDPSTLD